MIFRPSDDVLDQNGQVIPQINEFVDENISANDEHQVFHATENEWNLNVPNLNPDNIIIPEVDTEEVKAPDLSDLLTKTGTNDSENPNNQKEKINNEKIAENKENEKNLTEKNENKNIQSDDESIIENSEEKQNNTIDNSEVNNIKDDHKELSNWNNDIDETVPWKMSDEERIKLVSEVEWSVHSNLDLLVNEQWYKTIIKYRKVHRIVFKWWLFIVSTLIWTLIWTLCQVSAWQSKNYQIINDESIENINSWRDSDMPNIILQDIKENGVDIIIPYGTAKMDGKSFQSKSNLISYNWIILPQTISINYEKDKISMEDFNQKKMNRSDLKKILEVLVNDNIAKKTKDLRNPFDMKRIGQEFDWKLEDYFNLKCLDATKISDFVCNDFLKIFNKYGKYYDLSTHSSELLSYVENLEKYKKDIIPVCEIVKEYSIRAWLTYIQDFASIMNKCGEDYSVYYKKLTNFIEVENSMNQPEIPEKIYDDPDINAYKLISSWQNVDKFLNWTVNKNYIKSYFKFVKALIDKDKWTNKYLSPMYKDLLYIFNMEEIYTKLMNKWDLTSDIKNLINQINNWDGIWWYSLVNLLTTPNLTDVLDDSENTEQELLSIEDMFSQYYNMKDKLKIRKVDKISDEEIRLQWEITSNTIRSKVWDEQWGNLKATVSLKRKDNILYIENIKIANQQKLTDILNIRVKEEDTTLNAMLVYIDEQVWFWYNDQTQDIQENPTFCDRLWEIWDIELHICNDTWIILNKLSIEYKFDIKEWALTSFEINDDELNSIIKDNLVWVIITKDNTPTIIESIIKFNKEDREDPDIYKKLQVVEQFRLYFKIIPEIESIEWDQALVRFTLWEFDLQAYYDINTQMLSKISYVACDKTLEIKGLTIEVSSKNTSQLSEILNNPRIFFTKANQTIYKKYQNMCEEKKSE